LPAAPGPQSLAFEHDGVDWAGLYERLKARYGVWELARFEAVLRLADHRASDAAAHRAAAEGGAP
jgi:CRISPR-associated endonuclease/helicase Cas3